MRGGREKSGKRGEQRVRVIAAVSALICLGWVIVLPWRLLAAMAHGRAALAYQFVFIALAAIVGVDLIRRARGVNVKRGSLGLWGGLLLWNIICVGHMNPGTTFGRVGLAVSIAALVLGLIGGICERVSNPPLQRTGHRPAAERQYRSADRR
jgi:hypothetical protein